MVACGCETALRTALSRRDEIHHHSWRPKMRSYLLALRLIHIVSAVCWVGGSFVMVGFVLPAVKRAGPEGGKFMNLLVQRKLPVYLVIAAWSAVISGALLYWTVS